MNSLEKIQKRLAELKEICDDCSALRIYLVYKAGGPQLIKALEVALCGIRYPPVNLDTENSSLVCEESKQKILKEIADALGSEE